MGSDRLPVGRPRTSPDSRGRRLRAESTSLVTQLVKQRLMGIPGIARTTKALTGGAQVLDTLFELPEAEAKQSECLT